MNRLHPLAALCAAAVLGACAQLPPQQRPDTPLPQTWPGQAATHAPAPTGTEAGAHDWREFVVDPGLRTLVEQALGANRDARIAALQVEQLAAQYQIRRAALSPTVNVGFASSRQTSGDSNESFKNTASAGLQISAWEIDFFGRLAGLRDAALAQYLASEQAQRGTQVSLVAAVTSGWLDLQAGTALLELTRQTLASREQSLHLTRLRYDNGTASALDLRSAESLVESARATLAQQRLQQGQALNALTLLVGQPLDHALEPPPAPAAGALAELAPGLPAQVLLERPDVRAAEQQLAAANAQIGAARAAFFPRIALTASAGSASSALSGLFKAGSWGWSLAPQALLPIFDAGANQAGLDSARAGREIALAQYEKAIQTAFREVNDALLGRSTLADQFTAQQALVRSESERLRLSELRLQQGVASQLEVLDAQRSLFTAEQALVQTRYALLQNRVALFKTTAGR